MAIKNTGSSNIVSATLVVAASDSLHLERADYVCDGVDDQVEIQAAIDALPSHLGGVIHFHSGRYNISDTINITEKGVHFHGEGALHGGSKLSLVAGSNCNMINVSNSNFEFMQMELDGNKDNQTGADFYGIYGYPPAAPEGEALDMRIILSYFWQHKNAAVYSRGKFPYYLMSTFEWSEIGIRSDSEQAHIIGCWFYRDKTAIQLEDSTLNLISGCHIRGNGISTYPGSIILKNVEFSSISSSVISESSIGINLELSKYNIIQGSQIYNSEKEHILLEGSLSNVISGIHVRKASQSANDTYNAITLQSKNGTHSSHNVIAGNLIADIGSPSPKYMISEETSDQNNNFITANYVSGGVVATIRTQSPLSIVRNNKGYVEKNTGTSTGTGAQQTIAHGCAATPTKVILWNIEDGANPYQSAAADGTNIKITAVINQDYGWEAEVV